MIGTQLSACFGTNTLLFAQREVLQLFAHRRGVLTLLAFAATWLLLIYYPIDAAVSVLKNREFVGFFESMSKSYNMDHLLNWPSPELAVYWICALYIMPLFCILMSADQTASDKQRGTLRFLTLRASRESILLGRFLGQLTILTSLTLFTLLVTLVVASTSNTIGSASLILACIIAINLAVFMAPYIALMSLLSILFSSAKNVILVTVLIWVGIKILIGLGLYWQIDLSWLALLLPGSQVELLLKLDGWSTLNLVWWPLLQTLSYLTIGLVQIKRCKL